MRISDWSSDVCSSDLAGHGDQRIEALRLADVYRARVVDATIDSFIFEITGGSEKVDTFINLMRHVGLVAVARNGIVGITRGTDAACVIAPALPWARGIRRTGSLLPRSRWERAPLCLARARAQVHVHLSNPISHPPMQG